MNKDFVNKRYLVITRVTDQIDDDHLKVAYHNDYFDENVTIEDITEKLELLYQNSASVEIINILDLVWLKIKKYKD